MKHHDNDSFLKVAIERNQAALKKIHIHQEEDPSDHSIDINANYRIRKMTVLGNKKKFF